MSKLLKACKPIAEGDVSWQIRFCLYNEDFRSEFNPLLKPRQQSALNRSHHDVVKMLTQLPQNNISIPLSFQPPASNQ